MRGVAVWIAVFALANAVLAFHAPTLTEFVNQLPGRDKTGHIVVMGLFALLVTLSIPRHRTRLGRVAIPTGIALALVVVSLEEVSQLWLEHRRFSMADLASSYAGVLVFGALGTWLIPRYRNRPGAAASAGARSGGGV